MKRLFLFIYILIVVLFLSSCGILDEQTTQPTVAPTVEPTTQPTVAPTVNPTATPTVVPTTNAPTVAPTVAPTIEPTKVPTKTEILGDPYTSVSKETFYANYTEAESYMHAYYRTKHGLMSGSIDDADRYYKPNSAEAPKYKVTDTVYTYRSDGS